MDLNNITKEEKTLVLSCESKYLSVPLNYTVYLDEEETE